MARVYDPELKGRSTEWRHTGLPRGQKVRQNPSSVKLMVIITYDVQRGVRDNCPDLEDSVITLYDNARSHKAESVLQLIRRWGWGDLEHLPYSPDISPCDFDLIPQIKGSICGRWFATREDIDNAVRQ
ncbi:histone-lysine N-methyltransferase SETMAR [Trichonephila clavipes]|nr:histone-lysine N-methyltransferase SETMAR [Trichonephila clavipes]